MSPARNQARNQARDRARNLATPAGRASETRGGSMPDRRSVLALMTAALGLPLAGPAAAFVAPAAGNRPEIRRFGRHYLVNGWVLTAGDLDRLGLDAG